MKEIILITAISWGLGLHEPSVRAEELLQTIGGRNQPNALDLKTPLLVADHDGDGLPDILFEAFDFRYSSSSQPVLVSSRNQRALMRYDGDITELEQYGFGDRKVSLGDLNGDGIEDFVFSTVSFESLGHGGLTRFYVSSGRNGEILLRARGLPGHMDLYNVGDWDHDGKNDFAATNSNLISDEQSSLTVYSSSSGETLMTWQLPLMRGVLLSELDSNGHPKMALTLLHRGVSIVSLSERRIERTFTRDTGHFFFGENVAAIGDVDGDGSTDYAIGTASDGGYDYAGEVTVFSGRSSQELYTTPGFYTDTSIVRIPGSGQEGRADDFLVTVRGSLQCPGASDVSNVVNRISGRTGEILRVFYGLHAESNISVEPMTFDYNQDGVMDFVLSDFMTPGGGTEPYSFFILSGSNARPDPFQHACM